MSSNPTSVPHKFWPGQPVAQSTATPADMKVEDSGPIDSLKKPSDIRSEPLGLPKGFEWSTIDVNDESQMKEVYNLLYGNYVEDDDAMFRFNYSVDFLRWALTPPGYVQDWHIGVRSSSNKLLVGLITGIPVTTNVYDKSMKMAEINFLCVHKKLRAKRLAPVLIREVTRRVNLLDIWQATYTAGVKLPGAVAECRYYHRSINPQKLIEVGFSQLRNRATMSMTKKLYALPANPKTPGIREMREEDAPQVTVLLTEYLKKFALSVHFSEEDVRHWICPHKGVVESYVVEDPATQRITDFCSFYHLPSTVLGHTVHKEVKAAYSYYNVATVTPLVQLMEDALIFARNSGVDVLNCLDLMENKEFIEKLKFGVGDGTLHYYLYNWKCPFMAPEQVGLVLL